MAQSCPAPGPSWRVGGGTGPGHLHWPHPSPLETSSCDPPQPAPAKRRLPTWCVVRSVLTCCDGPRGSGNSPSQGMAWARARTSASEQSPPHSIWAKKSLESYQDLGCLFAILLSFHFLLEVHALGWRVAGRGTWLPAPDSDTV